jgi:hypothetical protein
MPVTFDPAVTPAKAGVPLPLDRCQGSGIPAFAGMTEIAA